jgi:hypothetical protein
LLLLPIIASALSCSSSSSNSSGSGTGTCNDAWNKAVAACPAANSMQQEQGFLSVCNDPSKLAPNCPMQASAFADCIKSASMYSCDSSGQPHAVGCDSQASALATCVSSGGPDAGPASD